MMNRQALSTTSFRSEVLVSLFLLAVVVATILYGQWLEDQQLSVRRWTWDNLLLVLPAFPLLFLQKKAGLPSTETLFVKKQSWRQTAGVGIFFGVLDVLVMKVILHPEPYSSLPPFLQPFPYSLFLYTAGALETEYLHRLLPVTILLLLNEWLFKGRFRKGLLIGLAIVTTVIEPILQFPDAALWVVIYATVSGIAMNAWQFSCYLTYGFGGTMAVRLGHYLIWHILLGVYVQLFELA